MLEQEWRLDDTLGADNNERAASVNRRNMIIAIGLVLMVGLVAGIIARVLSGPPAGRMLVAGDVRSVVRTVPAPAISYPSLSFTVKVISNAAPGTSAVSLVESVLTGRQFSVITSPPIPGQSSTQTAAGQPVVAGTLTAVDVRVGDHVTTGAVLAQLDTSMLQLGVQTAKLQAQSTKTTVRVLNNGIDTILDNIDKLATGRVALATGKAALAKGKAQIAAGKVQLAKAKATLLKAKSGLLDAQKKLLAAKKSRPQLEATLAALKKQAATYPPGQVPASLKAKIAQLEALLASIDPGLAKIAANLKQVDAGLAKIAAGEAQLATAQAKLATGAAQLATAQALLDAGASALHTAKKQAYKARDYVRIIAGGVDVGIVLAEAKLDQATIMSPVSGIVTQAPDKGTAVVVGAPLVRIQPDAPALVDAYVEGEQLGALHVGSIADITYDSGDGKVLHGTLKTIGSDAEYPPTSFPTDLVHMARTVKVTFQLDSGDDPPAGTPVDIAIHTD